MEAPKQYPNINVDFRKLDRDALLRLVNYFDVKISPQLSNEDLATTVAGIFASQTSSEHEVVDKFAAKFCYTQANNSSFPPEGEDNTGLLSPSKKTKSTIEYHHFHPASVGEQVVLCSILYPSHQLFTKYIQTFFNFCIVMLCIQVAAKSTKSGEETEGWILGNVLSYDINRETYEVQDEDDPKRILKLSFQQVRRLEDTAIDINRGDRVMGVFPETTSFYRATVVKSPKTPESSGVAYAEVVVRFDDDEDETGKWPARRVPARFVLRAHTFPSFFETEPVAEK
jgi:hypothetical protein